MLERSIFGLLIGLTVCVSIWRISQQESLQNNFQQQHSKFVHHHQLHENLHKLGRRNLNHEPNSSENSNQLTTITNRHNETTTTTTNIKKVNISIINSDDSEWNQLPSNDFNYLIDLDNFEFMLNQLPCPQLEISSNSSGSIKRSKPPILLVLVLSAPSNYLKRLLIRKTWGSIETDKLRVLFLLGAVDNQKHQQQIELENNMFNDLVQGNFRDAYRNMTYKHIMALKWFTYFCPYAKFLIKADDDVLLNTPELLRVLENVSNPKTSKNKNIKSDELDSENINTQTVPNISSNNLLFCQKQPWSMVKRSYRSKWRVSAKEYPDRYYPPYCPGYTILYSPDVAFKLYKLGQLSNYFWIDDVHIGTLAKKLNITIKPFQNYLLTKSNYDIFIENFKTDYVVVNQSQNNMFLFTWPDINENQIKILWKLIGNYYYNNKKKNESR